MSGEVERDAHGYYRFRDQRLLSVTNVLKRGQQEPDRLRDSRIKKAVQSALTKPDLEVDFHLVAAEREWGPLSDKGTRVHDTLEQWVKGGCVGEPEDCDDCRPYIDGFLHFYERYSPKFVMAERVAVNLSVGYAGRFDWIAEIDELGVTLGDYKTTGWANFYKPDWALQTSAYANAEGLVSLTEPGVLDPLPKIDSGLILVLPGDGSYKAVIVDIGPKVFSVFKSMARISKWKDIGEISKLGELP